MNFKVRALALLLFLEFTKSFSPERSSTTKFNKISLNKDVTAYGNITLGRTLNKKISSSSSTNAILKQNKKWKIGRITHKQFGIVNILWQKTKVFVDEDYSNLTCKATTIKITPATRKPKTFKKGLKLSSRQTKLQKVTPSYIEFYYLDQADDRIKRKEPSKPKLQNRNGNKTRTAASNKKKSSKAPLIKVNINTVRGHISQAFKLAHEVGQGNFYRNKPNKLKRTTFNSKSPLTVRTKAKTGGSKQTQHPKRNRLQRTTNIFSRITSVDSKRRHVSTVPESKYSFTTKHDINRTHSTKSYLVPASTFAADDKVKFFEIYDSNTPKLKKYVITNPTTVETDDKEINQRDDERILLDHVNKDIGHQDKNKTRYVKKHIQSLYSSEIKSKADVNNTKINNRHNLKGLTSTSTFQASFQKHSNASRPTVWTKYPFVAAYIYEPSHVRCDAAGISAHWLLAAASCLSRYRQELRGGLSAFVTYCSDSWSKPQMISYVKRTLLHPLHHPTDKIRRLFNAGLIQVVNSMADTCMGWGPAFLVSHQYTADEMGSKGTAVGWGLDRYDETYSATDILSRTLMIYEGQVHSQTCPGSTEYSQVKSSDEIIVRNVYCLVLPPSVAEQNDTVRGSLLLIGGKLLALYLKEERRSWGVQSAQYTGVWRLLPWLAETAREPDESFHLDI